MKQQKREWGGQFGPAEEERLGKMGSRGGVRTSSRHGWSDSPCAELHIWKRICEGGVNGNDQEEQLCYVCNLLCQTVTCSFSFAARVTLWLSSILIDICFKETATSSVSV